MAQNETFRYDYYDKDGNLVFQKVKIIQNGKKKYWTEPKLTSVPEKPLYNLPALIANRGGTLFVVEGEKDVDTLTRMNFTACCNFDGASAGKWREYYNPFFVGATVVVMTDIDKPGREFCNEIVNSLKTVAYKIIVIDLAYFGTVLPANGDISDMVSAVGEETVKNWLTALLRNPESYSGVEVIMNPWLYPQPVSTQISKPSFDANWLPCAIRKYVTDLAALLQVSPEMITCAVFSITSFLASKYVSLQLRPGWNEPSNLFFLVSAASGERKSITLASVAKPLLEFERTWNLNHAEEIRISALNLKKLEKSVASLRFQGSRDPSSLADIQNAENMLNSFQSVSEMRLVADDTTIEKLAEIMKKNDEKLLILSSEGTFLSTILHRYNDNANIDLVLKGYSNELVTIDRITRPSDTLYEASLSICAYVQPNVLNSLLGSTYLHQRGFNARFLVCCPPSSIGNRKFSVEANDGCSEQDWEELINALIAIFIEEKQKINLTLSPEATEEFSKFYERVEKYLADDDSEELRAFDSKLCGHTARLAINLHIMNASAENMHDILSNTCISRDTMKNAIAMGEYYRSHFIYALHVASSSQLEKFSTKLLTKLQMQGNHTITRREISRMNQNLKPDELDSLIKKFVDLGWMREKESTQTRGRPSACYEINPKLFNDNAQ